MNLEIESIYHILVYSQHGIWTVIPFEGHFALKSLGRFALNIKALFGASSWFRSPTVAIPALELISPSGMMSTRVM